MIPRSYKLGNTTLRMHYTNMLHLQKCLFYSVCTFAVWVFVTGIFLFVKFDALDHLNKYLSVAVYTLLVMIESARLYLGHYGNLSKRVPELAGFLMLTLLMQLPLVSFFLFNPNLRSTPTEVLLHAILWLLSLLEIIFGYFSLKEASSFAKSVYLSQSKSD